MRCKSPWHCALSGEWWFCHRRVADPPLRSSIYIQRRGSVGWRIDWIDAECHRICKIQVQSLSWEETGWFLLQASEMWFQSKASRVPNKTVSRSLWVARPWLSNRVKRMVTAVPQELKAFALPGVRWFCQRQVAPSSCSCNEINTVLTVLPLNSVSEMFAATAAKMSKQQGRRSRNSTPCVVTADRHTQAPNETVFYSWLLEQNFGDRGPKDLPLIWRRGTVGWKIEWVDAEWYAIWKIQGLF